jgi:hypothetical protein
MKTHLRDTFTSIFTNIAMELWEKKFYFHMKNRMHTALLKETTVCSIVVPSLLSSISSSPISDGPMEVVEE